MSYSNSTLTISEEKSVNDSIASDISELLKTETRVFISRLEEPKFEEDECSFMYLDDEEDDGYMYVDSATEDYLYAEYKKELNAFHENKKAMLSSLYEFAESINGFSSDKDIHERLSLALTDSKEYKKEKIEIVSLLIKSVNSGFSDSIRHLEKMDKDYIFSDITKAEMTLIKNKILHNLILIPNELLIQEQENLYRARYDTLIPVMNENHIQNVFNELYSWLNILADHYTNRSEFVSNFIKRAKEIKFLFDGSDELAQAFLNLSNIEFESSTVSDFLTKNSTYDSVTSRLSYLQPKAELCSTCKNVLIDVNDEMLIKNLKAVKRMTNKLHSRSLEQKTKAFERITKKRNKIKDRAKYRYESIEKYTSKISCDCMVFGVKKLLTTDECAFSSYADMLDVSIESNVFSKLRSNKNSISKVSSDPNMVKLRELETIETSKIFDGLVSFGYFIETPSPEQSEYVLAIVRGLAHALKELIAIDRNNLPISAYATRAVDKAYSARHSDEKKSAIYGKLATLHFRSESKARIERMIESNSSTLSANGESLDNQILGIIIGLIRL